MIFECVACIKTKVREDGSFIHTRSTWESEVDKNGRPKKPCPRCGSTTQYEAPKK